ncbi:hypothetical protein KO507_05580 [Gilvimarinus agarilyticus]|uniref:hypothetical protein n=1 Tax=Gilvimarinus sp. 2_MG-2023 TaxID=3062666 RepID=UPI001C08CB43|nr:hypothetical protein [Gilvimarinus sp. 2_MG-2023]MBU2885232.1 hypothetical protein [Gilvimarinus agarilyticus]MDO6570129.1 hypothetical protein [Gilvimarinus sp. 2_MG-2023]
MIAKKISFFIGKMLLIQFYVVSLLGLWWSGGRTMDDRELLVWCMLVLLAAHGLLYSANIKNSLIIGVLSFLLSLVVVFRGIYLYVVGVVDVPHGPYYVIIIPGLFLVYLSPLIGRCVEYFRQIRK